MEIMKKRRHKLILDLISQYNIGTQEELLTLLRDKGFDVTQATVSRDIKELGLHKKLNRDGRYVYTCNEKENIDGITDEMSIILNKSIVSTDFSLNTVVIKTLAGMAQGAASVLDAMHFPECLGTIAGDDTIFVVTRGEESSQKFCKKIKNMID